MLPAVPRSTPDPIDRIPRRESDVEVVRVIGAGSMGEVCFARDRELLRDVAFKRLKRKEVDDPMFRKAMVREARIAAQLDHPNIVPIHRLQQGPSGELGYVMKLVQGETLTTLLKRAKEHRDHGTLEPGERQSERLALLMRVVDAVAYAHDKGVVHRDLKPDNVLIGEHGTVYLSDWGLAKIVKRRGPLADLQTVQIRRDRMASEDTEVAGMMGTVAYMSPEQANGRTSGLGPESDVFTLGVMLYEVAYLRHPYRARTMQEMIDIVRAGKLRPGGRESVDPELLDIARRATALRPEDRYPHGSALADDLKRWRNAEPTEAGRDSLGRRIQRMLRRRPDLGLSAVVVLLLLDLILLLYVALAS